MRAVLTLLPLVLVASLMACGPSSSGDGGDDDDDGGPSTCQPGAGVCDGNTWYECGADGHTRFDEQACPEACDPGLGCVACVTGTRRCDGTVSMVCTNGEWGFGRDCGEWTATCGADGFCEDVCAEAERSASNVGCEYWPVPLANTTELDGTTFDFRVVVANPSPQDARVKVTRGATMVAETVVPPGGLEAIVLPWVAGQSFAIGEGNWQSLVTADGAYRLRSDAPVIATQYNPFEYSVGGTFSYTNDASLLLPAHTLTGRHIAVSYSPLSRRTGSTGFGGGLSSIRYPGYLAVVGVTPTPTQVTIHAAGEVQASANGRIARTPRGGTLTFTLARGEVAHVTAAPPPECAAGRPGYVHVEECETLPGFPPICDIFDTCDERDHDLTGSRIVSSAPVEVFGGHTCAYVPTSSQACDHLEEQMPPVETWGSDYVGAPMGDGGITGNNLLRVVAAFDDTRVTLTPPQGGVDQRTLQAGEVLETMVSSPFRVQASEAVAVAQFLLGQEVTGAPRGDPALTLLTPAEQYRSDYTFILPTSYNAGTNGQNHVLVIRPPGLAITVDGAPLTASFQPVGDREIAVVPLAGGTHRMAADGPFGLIAYGLGSYTSYATPAGLDLEPITVIGRRWPTALVATGTAGTSFAR